MMGIPSSRLIRGLMWEGDAAGSMRLNLFVPLATARHPGADTRLQQQRRAALFATDESRARSSCNFP